MEGMIVTGRASWPRGRAFGEEEVAGSELEKEEGKEEGKVVGWEIGRGEVEVGGGGRKGRGGGHWLFMSYVDSASWWMGKRKKGQGEERARQENLVYSAPHICCAFVLPFFPPSLSPPLPPYLKQLINDATFVASGRALGKEDARDVAIHVPVKGGGAWRHEG